MPVTESLRKQKFSEYILAGWHNDWYVYIPLSKPEKETTEELDLSECLEQRAFLNCSKMLVPDAIFCTKNARLFSKCRGSGGEPLGNPVHHNGRLVPFWNQII